MAGTNGLPLHTFNFWTTDPTTGNIVLESSTPKAVPTIDGADYLRTGVGGPDGGSNWFGQGGYMQQGAQIAGALGGLAQAYTGWQGLQLAKKAMQFEKDKYNRDLANQGLAYNTALEDRAKIAAVGGGLSETATKSKLAGLASKKMNTSPVG